MLVPQVGLTPPLPSSTAATAGRSSTAAAEKPNKAGGLHEPTLSHLCKSDSSSSSSRERSIDYSLGVKVHFKEHRNQKGSCDSVRSDRKKTADYIRLQTMLKESGP